MARRAATVLLALLACAYVVEAQYIDGGFGCRVRGARAAPGGGVVCCAVLAAAPPVSCLHPVIISNPQTNLTNH
jgi:hypothetical protein